MKLKQLFMGSGLAFAGLGSAAPASGNVYADGTEFKLDGSNFYFAGTNAYWLPFLKSDDDISSAMKQMADAGLKVVRTWGFSDQDSTNEGSYPAYFQSWADGKPTINDGDDGLKRLDAVVSAAEDAGLKLVIPFTNNWEDYGGMDVYVRNVASDPTHDQFYTNDDIKQYFKDYIEAVVSRYSDSTAIFAWELANEPRCKGTSMEASSSCNTDTITSWVDEISEYIKSLDSNHMVTVGDEGFFNKDSDDWINNGSEGVDFEANLALSNIDFGTFHLYPDSWSITSDQCTKFISDHADASASAKKPVLFEEYGIVGIQDGTDSVIDEYKSWQSLVVDSLAADLYWQFGPSDLSETLTLDEYTIYSDNPGYKALVTDHAAEMSAKN